MKKYFFFGFISLSFCVFAERITFPTFQQSGLTGAKKSDNTHVFSNVITVLDLDRQRIASQDFTALNLEGYVYHGKVGDPKLPAKTQLLEVAKNSDVKIRILSSKHIDLKLSEKGFDAPLLPVQPSVRKSEKPEQNLVKNRSAYRKKTFNQRDIVDLEHLGIAKNRQFVQLNICPIQYLPSENIIRVYYAIDFELDFIEVPHSKSSGSSFSENPNPLIYQIVSDQKFEKVLAPFVAWKTEKGFDVRVAYTSHPAVENTTTSIRNYLKGQYDQGEGADYLLLVGDIAEIPPFPTSFPANHEMLNPETHITDFYYAEYTGDHLPDAFYGRLSASNASQLLNQIEKIIAMEKLDIPTSDFLKKSLLIAGEESSTYNRNLLNAQVNYGSKYYFNKANGVDSTILWSPSSAGQSSTVKAFINNGGGFVNYTAHGGWDRWASPQMTVFDVSKLSNTSRYPFVIGNCCLSGKFEKTECFAEALVRGGQKGAVTYIGASNSTYFNEDFIWAVGSVESVSNPNNITYETSGLGVYDRIFHLHGEAIEDWSRTAGEIVFWGNAAVQTANATWDDDMKRYYWEIYHVFGDPSFAPYFIEPKTLHVTHPQKMTALEPEFFAETGVPYAYVGFSINGRLLAGGQANHEGKFVFAFDEELPQGEAKIVVTAQNHMPYIAAIPITPNDKPHVRAYSHQLSLNSEPSDRIIFNETMKLAIGLKNRSTFEAKKIQIQLKTPDSNVVKINQISETVVESLPGLDSVVIHNDYQLEISPNIPDRYQVQIEVRLSYNDTINSLSAINFIASAPEIAIQNFSTAETNGRFEIVNIGSLPIENAEIKLQSQTDGFAVSNLTPNSSTLVPDAPISFSFDLSKAQNLSNFSEFTLGLLIEKNTYSFHQDLLGVYSSLSEDFEQRAFDHAVWMDSAWIKDSLSPFEGMYSAKSSKITDEESSNLTTQEFELIGGDSIVFYYKVSSEDCGVQAGKSCGDGLFFSTSEKNSQWTKIADFYGEIPWTRAAFPVSAGVQSFKWAYVKDSYVSEGDDCAWVDQITFPKMKNTPESTAVTSPALPDHIAFDVVVADGFLHARIHAEKPGKATIRLVNMLGQNMATVVSNGIVGTGQNDFYFNLSNLPKGTYVCTYFNGTQIQSRKIIR